MNKIVFGKIVVSLVYVLMLITVPVSVFADVPGTTDGILNVQSVTASPAEPQVPGTTHGILNAQSVTGANPTSAPADTTTNPAVNDLETSAVGDPVQTLTGGASSDGAVMTNPNSSGGVTGANPGGSGGATVGANPSPTNNVGIKNPLKWDDFTLAIGGLVDQVKYVAGIVAVLAFIWVGWLYVRAMGDPKKIGEAHKAFMYVAIGVAILLGAEILITIIQNTIGNLQ